MQNHFLAGAVSYIQLFQVFSRNISGKLLSVVEILPLETYFLKVAPEFSHFLGGILYNFSFKCAMNVEYKGQLTVEFKTILDQPQHVYKTGFLNDPYAYASFLVVCIS